MVPQVATGEMRNASRGSTEVLAWVQVQPLDDAGSVGRSGHSASVILTRDPHPPLRRYVFSAAILVRHHSNIHHPMLHTLCSEVHKMVCARRHGRLYANWMGSLPSPCQCKVAAARVAGPGPRHLALVWLQRAGRAAMLSPPVWSYRTGTRFIMMFLHGVSLLKPISNATPTPTTRAKTRTSDRSTPSHTERAELSAGTQMTSQALRSTSYPVKSHAPSSR